MPVPVDGSEAKGHGEAVRMYQVQIDGSEVTCHDEIVSVTSKKRGTSASAGSPRRPCLASRISRGAEYLIDCCEFSLIDFKG